MKNINYEVNRDEIYVGDVCVIDPTKLELIPDGLTGFNELERMYKESNSEEYLRELYKKFENRPFLMGNNHLSYFYSRHPHDNKNCYYQRSMLFVLDENKHANDLLYNSPRYPIINISSHEDVYHSQIVLLHYTYWIGKLLECFGYPEVLRYPDIIRIRKHLFSCDYVYDNCEKFGRKETGRDESGFEVYDSKGRHRTFDLVIDDNPLDKTYFDCIHHNKDYFVEDYSNHEPIGFMQYRGEVIDAFKPGQLEGPIRSLYK